jgi:hypothetical protein
LLVAVAILQPVLKEALLVAVAILQPVLGAQQVAREALPQPATQGLQEQLPASQTVAAISWDPCCVGVS